MQIINCRVLINEYQDIAGVGVTPAEALLLRHIHDKGAATHSKGAAMSEKKNFWKFLRNPVLAGEAQTIDEDPDTGKVTARERSNAEEIVRLRGKYLLRAESGAQHSHIVDDLWPGEDPDLPQTFEEIHLEVAPQPEEKPAKKPKKETA